MKKVAILQSNYIPWKGYFDLIAAVDEFIIYDNVQFTKNDWRNRNKIKTPRGAEWISVPVGIDINRNICDVELPDSTWQQKHWRTISHNYCRAAHFKAVADELEPLYLQETYTHLSQLNLRLINWVCSKLGITTKISSSFDYQLIEGKTERLANLCVQAGATEYFSGPAARSYIDESIFADQGIKFTWFDYGGYPEYPQLWGEFIHAVTILDLLFNCGFKEAPRYMKYIHP